ncbi:class I SAM-dependent methyltransferase [Thermodesulfobacteriota bacterium]
MTDHVKITIDTYNRIASDYNLTALPEIRAWEEESMHIFNKMIPGSSVLAPGCGDGRDSRFLKSLGLSVTSFDLSKEMLAQAKKHDPTGIYRNLDIRSISDLDGSFDSVYASGCLYHIIRSEFSDFLSTAPLMMSDRGILYLNMKIGTGNEIKAIPGKNYPGDSVARKSLEGPRYYEYYLHEELLGLFSGYSVIRWRNMEVQREGVHEYWLQNVTTFKAKG